MVGILEGTFCKMKDIEKFDRLIAYSSVSQEQSMCNMFKLYKLQDVFNVREVCKLEHLATVLPDMKAIAAFRSLISEYTRSVEFDADLLNTKVFHIIDKSNLRTLAMIINQIRLGTGIDNHEKISNEIKLSLELEKISNFPSLSKLEQQNEKKIEKK